VRSWVDHQHQPVNYYWPQGVGGDPSVFWSTPNIKNVSLQKTDGPDRNPAVRVSMVGRRPFYTIVSHGFSSPQDWSERRGLFLDVRGEGTGLTYQLLVYTDVGYLDSISFTFADIQPGWRVLAFDLRSPNDFHVRPDLHHVVALRIATNDKATTGSFELGSMTVSQPRPQ
jgi:hypothetical protein